MGKKDELPPQRLAYRIDELVGLLGVSKRTIERRIADGTLRSTTAPRRQAGRRREHQSAVLNRCERPGVRLRKKGET